MESTPKLKVHAYVYDGQIMGLTYYPDNLPKGWKTYECPTVPYEGKEYDVTHRDQVIYDETTDQVVMKPQTLLEDQ